jgi:hypothetical protein
MLDKIADGAAVGLVAILSIAFLLWLGRWAVRDARRRKKPALLVLIAVLLFFPWGWMAWVLFRPPLGPRVPFRT